MEFLLTAGAGAFYYPSCSERRKDFGPEVSRGTFICGSFLASTMTTLRCTAKLRKFLGGPAPRDAEERIGDWYANLLWIERRKCLMFTHSETLFTFMALDVRKAEVLPLGAFFVSKLHTELASEGLPADTFGEVDPETVALGTTASRSVLGSMNNLAYLAEWAITDAGGVGHCNV